MCSDMISEYYLVVEFLEYLPGDWRRYDATWLVGSMLGYIWHELYQGFALYHLFGTSLGMVTQTEEAARLVLEQLTYLPGAQIGEQQSEAMTELLASARSAAVSVAAAGYALSFLESEVSHAL